MEKIKIIERVGVPETNSSSCHSITICRDKIYEKFHNLPINSDNKIILTKDLFCHKENYMYNDPLNKLGYLICAAICKRYLGTSNDVSTSSIGDKQLRKVYSVVKKFTGVSEIMYSGDIINDFDVRNFMGCSLQRADQVMETKELIKDFIFNPRSWIWGYYDGGDINPNTYFKKIREDQIKNKPAMISFDFKSINGPVIDINVGEYCGFSTFRSIYNYVSTVEDDMEFLFDITVTDDKGIKFEKFTKLFATNLLTPNGVRYSARCGNRDFYYCEKECKFFVIYLKIETNSSQWAMPIEELRELISLGKINDIILIPITINSSEYGEI